VAGLIASHVEKVTPGFVLAAAHCTTAVECANSMLKPYVTPSERIRKSNVARAGFCTEENRGRILFVVDTSQAYRIVNNNQSPTAIAMNQWRISLEDGNFRHRAAFTTGFPAAGLTGMIVVSIAGCAGTRLTTGCAGAMRSMDSPSCVELSALGEGGNAGVEPLTDSGEVYSSPLRMYLGDSVLERL